MEIIKNKIRKFLISCNIHIGKITSKENLQDFFRSLKPIKTEYDLIRMGGAVDGGYLIPDDLEGIEICFSPGVSRVAEFENDLTKRGIRCFLADYSVEKPPINNNLFDFEKKYLGEKNDEIYMTLDHWIGNKAPEKRDFILQMDIEGGEYAVLHDVSLETLNKFRIVVIEFHGLDGLMSKSGFNLISLAFSKLLKSFSIVHMHPNNVQEPVFVNGFLIPPIIEFTFLRRDRVKFAGEISSLPHPLDRANVNYRRDYPLPACWR